MWIINPPNYTTYIYTIYIYISFYRNNKFSNDFLPSRICVHNYNWKRHSEPLNLQNTYLDVYRIADPVRGPYGSAKRHTSLWLMRGIIVSTRSLKERDREKKAIINWMRSKREREKLTWGHLNVGMYFIIYYIQGGIKTLSNDSILLPKTTFFATPLHFLQLSSNLTILFRK